jgi:hypothetical protein
MWSTRDLNVLAGVQVPAWGAWSAPGPDDYPLLLDVGRSIWIAGKHTSMEKQLEISHYTTHNRGTGASCAIVVCGRTGEEPMRLS